MKANRKETTMNKEEEVTDGGLLSPPTCSAEWYRKRAEEVRHNGKTVSQYNHFLGVAEAIEYTELGAESDCPAPVCSPKIIQILVAPNDALWQGRLIGLGDDGVTYQSQTDEWEPMVKPLNFQRTTERKRL